VLAVRPTGAAGQFSSQPVNILAAPQQLNENQRGLRDRRLPAAKPELLIDHSQRNE